MQSYWKLFIEMMQNVEHQKPTPLAPEKPLLVSVGSGFHSYLLVFDMLW